MERRVLVVEDHPDVRRVIALSLCDMGCEVVEAEKGEEGLRKAAAENPRLILLDLVLPDISGIEVAERLKQNAQTSHIPIVAYTGWVSDELEAKALEVGISDYLVKPVSRAVLKNTVEKFMKD